jgi:type VII secretion protein EccB
MSSRRDQVQAHTYVVGRLASALVHGEPDAPESPLRRTGLGSFAGLLVGALLLAVFLIWGLLSPESKAATMKPGELVMVSGTGARYLYAGGALRPVLNWSSALMLMGGQATMTTVSASSLNGLPQGQPLGVVGAPETLPSTVNLGSWLACSQRSGTGAGLVTLSIGSTPLLRPVPAAGAVVVSAAGRTYLLWHGERLRVDAPWILAALGLVRAPVIPVSPAWLNAVPAGPDLRPMTVTALGAAGPAISGSPTEVGQVLLVTDVASSPAYYLVDRGGITPITATQAALELGDPGRAVSGTALRVSQAAISRLPVLGQNLADGAGTPPAPPADFTSGGVPCVDYPGSGGSAPALAFGPDQAGTPPALGAPGVRPSPGEAGLISVAAGAGALVQAADAPGVAAGSYFLVTDEGVKFPVAAADLKSLGYRPAAAASLPAALLGLLPTGPALDLPALRG